jgi:hypothetical protein
LTLAENKQAIETTKPATPVVEPGVRPAVEPRPAPPALIPDEGNSPLESPAKAEMEEEAGDMYAQKLQELLDYYNYSPNENSDILESQNAINKKSALRGN